MEVLRTELKHLSDDLEGMRVANQHSHEAIASKVDLINERLSAHSTKIALIQQRVMLIGAVVAAGVSAAFKYIGG